MINHGKRLFFEKTDPKESKLIYVHVPKCGGTSLIVALKQAYRNARFQSFDYIPTYHAARSTRNSWQSLEWLETWFRIRAFFLHKYILQNHEFIYGHMPLSKAALAAGVERQYQFFTILRDPVERFISNYVYDKVGPGIRIPDILPTGESSPAAELELFLEAPEASWMANEQLLMIAGLPVDGLDLGSPEMRERALHNAEKISLIGWTEEMARFSSRFEKCFARKLNIEHHNTTENWMKEESGSKETFSHLFSAKIRDRIRLLAAPEYAWLKDLRP